MFGLGRATDLGVEFTTEEEGARGRSLCVKDCAGVREPPPLPTDHTRTEPSLLPVATFEL